MNTRIEYSIVLLIVLAVGVASGYGLALLSDGGHEGITIKLANSIDAEKLANYIATDKEFQACFNGSIEFGLQTEKEYSIIEYDISAEDNYYDAVKQILLILEKFDVDLFELKIKL